MSNDYWLRQSVKTPLFEDLLWSRPENKRTAGKLLIIGGSAHGFAAPAESYNFALMAGIGTAKVLLPDSIQKIVGGVMENGEFASSTRPSGGFSKQALAEFLDYATWADGVLVAGDLGRNSETVVLLEQFVSKYSGLLTITKDAADNLIKSPDLIIDRPETLLVLSFAQLQKLAAGAGKAISFNLDLLRLVEMLHELTTEHKTALITKHLDQIIVAVDGKVSTTQAKNLPIWRVQTATDTAVWWLQNPTKTFEALTTAISEISK